MRRLKLTRLVFEERNNGRENGNGSSRSLPGDPCPREECEGELKVYSVKQEPGMTIRFLHCPVCKFIPEDSKWVTPIQGL